MAALFKSFVRARKSFAKNWIAHMPKYLREDVLYPLLVDEPKYLARLAMTCKELYDEIRSLPLNFFADRSVELFLATPLRFVSLRNNHCVLLDDDDANMERSWMQPGCDVQQLHPLFSRCVLDPDEVLWPEDTFLLYTQFVSVDHLPTTLKVVYNMPEAADMEPFDVYHALQKLAQGGNERTVCGCPYKSKYTVSFTPTRCGSNIHVSYIKADGEYELDNVFYPPAVHMEAALSLEAKVDVAIKYVTDNVFTLTPSDKEYDKKTHDEFLRKAAYAGRLLKKARAPADMLVILTTLADVVYDKASEDVACVVVTRMENGFTTCVMV